MIPLQSFNAKMGHVLTFKCSKMIYPSTVLCQLDRHILVIKILWDSTKVKYRMIQKIRLQTFSNYSNIV